jgi:membrane protein implicated in regulation of membrane protease activity
VVAIIQLELAFNLLILIFSVYCFWYIGASVPTPDPGKMGAGVWPQLLLGVLAFLLLINIYHVIKKYKHRKHEEKEAADAEKIKAPMSALIKKIIWHKLLWGSVFLLAYSLIQDYIGFLLSTVVFVFSYMGLLSERRLRVRIVASIVITIVIYLLFTRVLQVPLPRGTGIFREFALWLESI